MIPMRCSWSPQPIVYTTELRAIVEKHIKLTRHIHTQTPFITHMEIFALINVRFLISCRQSKTHIGSIWIQCACYCLIYYTRVRDKKTYSSMCRVQCWSLDNTIRYTPVESRQPGNSKFRSIVTSTVIPSVALQPDHRQALRFDSCPLFWSPAWRSVSASPGCA